MSLLETLQNLSYTRKVQQVLGTTLGDAAFVREVSGGEIDRVVATMPAGARIGRTEFVTLALCDAGGTPALDAASAEHRELVGKLPNSDLQKLFDAARELNGMEDEADPTPGGD